MNHDRSYSVNPDFKSSNSSPENFQVTWAAAWQAMGLPAGSSLPTASATALGTMVYNPLTMTPNDAIKTSLPLHTLLPKPSEESRERS